MTSEIAIYSTCPEPGDDGKGADVSSVREVAALSEAADCAGMLIYSDNRLVDPWLVAQAAIEATERLEPLVAVQPIYMHPYTVAKMVATLGYFYGRRLCLNMIAGGFKRDLEALADTTPHDERYARLTEYTTIVRELLDRSSRGRAYSFAGRYYSVANLKLTPSIPPELRPDIFVSGSSEAGREAGATLGAVSVRYPKPAADYDGDRLPQGGRYGIRVGIIARDSDDAAWDEAWRRFPPDRKGQIAHSMAMKVTDSEWHKQLSRQAEQENSGESNPYWLHPFQNYHTFCPYLVGSTERISQELAAYVRVGYRTVILDIPPNEGELQRIGEVLARAAALA